MDKDTHAKQNAQLDAAFPELADLTTFADESSPAPIEQAEHETIVKRCHEIFAAHDNGIWPSNLLRIAEEFVAFGRASRPTPATTRQAVGEVISTPGIRNASMVRWYANQPPVGTKLAIFDETDAVEHSPEKLQCSMQPCVAKDRFGATERESDAVDDRMLAEEVDAAKGRG